jgi:Fic family protein
MSKYEDIVKLWQSFNIQTEAALEAHLDSFRILFAYNSNKIENINTTYEDTYQVFDRGRVSNYTGDIRTLIEIQNQKAAYQYLVNSVIAKEPITESLVLEFHKLLTEGTYDERRVERGEKPGAYKQHHYVVGVNETGAAPEMVAEEIGELIDEIADADIESKNVLAAAAYFHAKFENIHPFADGNGRTGRILMNYFLMRHNHPPVNVYEEDKADYYKALDAYDTGLDIEPLSGFIEQQIVKTWEKTLDRAIKRKQASRER